MRSPAQLLWTPSRSQIEILSTQAPTKAAQQLGLALQESDEFLGKVTGSAFKLWRARRYANSRNTFAPILYGVIVPTEEGSRILGHFQLSPVMRLFLAVWFGGSTLLAVTLLLMSIVRFTPDATAAEALPVLVLAMLPLLGWLILRWQQRKGREDEMKLRNWLDEVVRSA